MKKEYQQLMKKRPEDFQNSEEPGSIFIYTDLDKIAEVEQKCHTSVGIMYQDQYIYLLKDAVRHPNGKDGTYIRILYATEGVGVDLSGIAEGICGRGIDRGGECPEGSS